MRTSFSFFTLVFVSFLSVQAVHANWHQSKPDDREFFVKGQFWNDSETESFRRIDIESSFEGRVSAVKITIGYKNLNEEITKENESFLERLKENQTITVDADVIVKFNKKQISGFSVSGQLTSVVDFYEMIDYITLQPSRHFTPGSLQPDPLPNVITQIKTTIYQLLTQTDDSLSIQDPNGVPSYLNHLKGQLPRDPQQGSREDERKDEWEQKGPRAALRLDIDDSDQDQDGLDFALSNHADDANDLGYVSDQGELNFGYIPPDPLRLMPVPSDFRSVLGRISVNQLPLEHLSVNQFSGSSFSGRPIYKAKRSVMFSLPSSADSLGFSSSSVGSYSYPMTPHSSMAQSSTTARTRSKRKSSSTPIVEDQEMAEEQDLDQDLNQIQEVEIQEVEDIEFVESSDSISSLGSPFVSVKKAKSVQP